MGPIALEQYDIPDTSTSDVFPFYYTRKARLSGICELWLFFLWIEKNNVS
jgi:hypothetical protein